VICNPLEMLKYLQLKCSVYELMLRSPCPRYLSKAFCGSPVRVHRGVTFPRNLVTGIPFLSGFAAGCSVALSSASSWFSLKILTLNMSWWMEPSFVCIATDRGQKGDCTLSPYAWAERRNYGCGCADRRDPLRCIAGRQGLRCGLVARKLTTTRHRSGDSTKSQASDTCYVRCRKIQMATLD
jgi:hypothetical protein